MAGSRMLTIGHSTLPVGTFVAILQKEGVRTLIDVRTVPKSSYNPQFGQERLASALKEARIEYHWRPSLGGLRRPRKELAGVVPLNAGWENESFRGYADYMQTPQFAATLDELLDEIRSGGLPANPVLMCAEAVPWRCHRSLIADALLVRGWEVEHILYDKQGLSHLRSHQMTSFARVDGLRIWYPAPDSLFKEDPGPLRKKNNG